MMQRSRFSSHLIYLFLLFYFFSYSTPSPAIAAPESLEAADACRDSLKEKPERKKNRSHWEKCVEKYQNTFSFTENKDRASYEVARLYQELYLYSSRLEDLHQARRHYTRFLTSSPKPALAADAKKQIDKLEPLLRDFVEEKRVSEPGLPPRNVPPGKGIVANIRHGSYPDHTRVVIDLDRPVRYKVIRLTSSQAILVELSHAALGELFKKTRLLPVKEGFLRQIEIKPKEEGQIDIVLSFKKLGPHKVIPLGDPDRLVIDVSNPSPQGTPKKEGGSDPADSKETKPIVIPPPPPLEIRRIVIDPGHGGKDPGAIGARGLMEKEVVLDVSLRLRELIRRKLKKQVIMTRHQDVFIPLEERTLLANAQKADLFVSVHANSSPKRNTQGIEVYLLGRATDENAMATAARENAASHKAALDFQEIILNDLERDFTLNESLEFAHFTQNAFIETLIPKYPTETLGVKRAPFFVLAHTNMPAILAEISFISNPVEEKRLQSGSYRQKVAEALLKGIEGYIRSLESQS